MKKKIIIAIVAMACAFSCSTEGDGGEQITITFAAPGVDGVTMPSPEKISKGKSLGSKLPDGPDRGSGWSFDAWYTDPNDLATKVETATAFNEDTTVYARWVVTTDAAVPSITTPNQPQSANYTEDGGVLTPVAGGSGMAALTVTATVTDGGTISYGWFKADDAAAATVGTAVTSGDGTVSNNGASFTPAATARGTYYFYAVATNTNNGVNGNTTAERRSNTATIRITGPLSVPPNVTIGGVEIAFDASNITPEKGRYGSAHTGGLAFTSMGYVVLKDTEYASVNVSFGPFVNTDDSIKVQKITVPNSGSSIPPASDWESAGSTLAGAAFTGKDVIQIQHTRAAPPGSSGVAAAEVVYYTLYIRRAIEIPYLANAAAALQIANEGGNTTTIPNAGGWDNAAQLIIDRPYMQDSPRLGNSEYDPANPPVIKLLWSDDGLYFYIYVADASVALDGASDHETDNVEIFISENYDWTGGDWNQLGGQYRIARSGSVSGDSPVRVARMVNSTATGYTLAGRISWAAPATAENGKMLGFDPQLAYSPRPGTRDACILWNSFLAGSYQNKSNAGIIFLKGK